MLKELSRYGQPVSPIKMVSLGCKSPLMKHIMCHRRQIFMILKDNSEELNLSFNFRIDGFNYMVFATSETMKCFACGMEGHLICLCPEKVSCDGDGAWAGPSSSRDAASGGVAPAGSADREDSASADSSSAENLDQTGPGSTVGGAGPGGRNLVQKSQETDQKQVESNSTNGQSSEKKEKKAN
ncbi:hypothetical protein LDENG_00079810 [Lucifuga dentata]|nr:hypothetical protein LDENG_00079810 [Lucifuga dentata]